MAAPLAKCKKVTMISDGSGEIGAAKLTREVLDIVATYFFMGPLVQLLAQREAMSEHPRRYGILSADTQR